MKTRTGTKQVEVTIYGCDRCDFEDQNPRMVEFHLADRHLCLEQKDNKYRFDSEEDALKWLIIKKIPYCSHAVEWNGPGWYQTQTWPLPRHKSEYPDIGIKLCPCNPPE